jgi:hypothetical protein
LKQNATIVKHTTQVILLAALLANGHYLFAADSTAAAAETAAKPPPHPGEPAAHQALIAGAPSNPARIYAREHPAEPPRVEPVYLKPSRTDHWEITLPKLHPNGADAILTLAVRDGAVVSGYTLAPSVDNFFHYTSTYRLELAGDRLTGSVRIRFLSKDQLNASEFMPGGDERVGILDVRSASGKLNGQMEWLGGAAPQKTAVTGSVFTGGRPSLPRDAVAGGELWPGHRGALGSGAAVDQGHVLVSDMSLARPVWKVAEDLPDGRAHQSGAGSMGTIMGDRSCVDWLRHSGAKSGPVVADGCVYLYTMIPSGVMSDQTGMPVKYALSEFDRAVVSQAAHDWLPGKPASPPAADASAKPRGVLFRRPHGGDLVEDGVPVRVGELRREQGRTAPDAVCRQRQDLCARRDRARLLPRCQDRQGDLAVAHRLERDGEIQSVAGLPGHAAIVPRQPLPRNGVGGGRWRGGAER